MERLTWYYDSERSVNSTKDGRETESPTSWATSTFATSGTETEDDTEIQEEFCAIMERIKSEGMEIGDTKPVVLHGDYKAKRSEQSPEPIPESSHDASLLLRCRLCAIENKNMVDIFGSKEEDILKMIKCCLHIAVKETDTLPKRACRVCLDRLKLCYQFNQIVAEAESQLLALDRRALIKSEGRDENCQPSPGATVRPETEGTRSCGVTQNVEPLVTLKNSPTIAQILESRPELTHCSVVLVAIDNQTEPRSLRCNDYKKDGRRRDDRRNHSNPSIDDSHSGNKLSDIGSQSISEPEVSRVTRSGLQTNQKNLFKTRRVEKSKDVNTNSKTSSTNNPSGPHEKVNDSPLANPLIEAPADMKKRRYNCKECGKTYSRKSGLVEHTRIHTGERLHTCQYCEKKFIWKSHRDIHIQRVHSEERPFKCSHCEKSFKSMDGVKNHKVRRHYNGDIPLHRCSVCDRAFQFECALKIHVLKHTGEKRWQCDHCKNRYTLKSGLKYHLTRCKGESEISKRRHKCNLCPKSFDMKFHLTRHYRLHTGKNTHSCEYCKKKFATRWARDHHLFVHVESRFQKCLTYDQLIQDHPNLKRFANNSTDNRPQCDYCKDKFASKQTVTRHIENCKKRYE